MKTYLFHFSWILMVAIGIWKTSEFTYTPGASVTDISKFPASSKLNAKTLQPTLLVFLHPKCSCSSSTLEELKRLLPELTKVRVVVVFGQPPGRDPAWTKSELWEKAQNLKGTELFLDKNNAEMSLFKISTSGQAFLFNAEDELVYSGGLTPGRGHEGVNDGQVFIREWLKKPSRKSFFDHVFGCGIFGEKV